MLTRRVVCAAIRDASGRIVLGARHFDHRMVETIRGMTSYAEPWEQGFIDQRGNFLTRQEAWVIAVEASQIVRDVPGPVGTLFSEHLY